MVKETPAGDDLEMGGVALGPAQISKAHAAKALQGIIGGNLGQRPFDFGPKAPLRLLRDRRQQILAAGKMPERRPRRLRPSVVRVVLAGTPHRQESQRQRHGGLSSSDPIYTKWA